VGTASVGVAARRLGPTLRRAPLEPAHEYAGPEDVAGSGADVSQLTLSLFGHDGAVPRVAGHLASETGRWSLVRADAVEAMRGLRDGSVDVIFADPPYFLSNGGSTCRGGARVSVDKGAWDQSKGLEADHRFNVGWLEEAQRVLSPSGSIWVSGTHHVIFSVGFAMQGLGFKVLNQVTWEKPNPPPNLGRRTLTHSTETLIWAAKGLKSRYRFNYAELRAANGGKQQKDVWRFTAPLKAERAHGRHPTQKPVVLLDMVLRASCGPGALVLDPFCGSGTTGVAALRLGHRFLGVDLDEEHLETARRRLEEVSR